MSDYEFSLKDVDLVFDDYPYSNTDAIQTMASPPYKCKGMSSLAGAIRIEFEGLNSNRPPELVALLKVKAVGFWARISVSQGGDSTARSS